MLKIDELRIDRLSSPEEAIRLSAAEELEILELASLVECAMVVATFQRRTGCGASRAAGLTSRTHTAR